LWQAAYDRSVSVTPDLKQLRYVTAVAKEQSFSRAAETLHVAQQAVSQQVKLVEDLLGIQLFERTNRGVTITPAGEVFVQEARRTLNAAERVAPRTQAAARGEAGTLRIAYTLATVYETLPALLDNLAAEQPELRLRPQEVFGVDVEELVHDERFDLALAPRMALGGGLDHRAVRHEDFAVAVAEDHPSSGREPVKLSEFAGDTLQVWPREMSPGYYDAVLSACRAAGFEPKVAEQAAGSTVWGDLARGNGFGLVVASLRLQLPGGVGLVRLEPPAPRLTIDLIWSAERRTPAVERVLDAAKRLGSASGWL
jgi:DNA-binding transcriptional LysR family regulator